MNKHNLDKDHTISHTELKNAFEDVSINYRIIYGTWTSRKGVKFTSQIPIISSNNDGNKITLKTRHNPEKQTYICYPYNVFY